LAHILHDLSAFLPPEIGRLSAQRRLRLSLPADICLASHLAKSKVHWDRLKDLHPSVTGESITIISRLIRTKNRWAFGVFWARFSILWSAGRAVWYRRKCQIQAFINCANNQEISDLRGTSTSTSDLSVRHVFSGSLSTLIGLE